MPPASISSTQNLRRRRVPARPTVGHCPVPSAHRPSSHSPTTPATAAAPLQKARHGNRIQQEPLPCKITTLGQELGQEQSRRLRTPSPTTYSTFVHSFTRSTTSDSFTIRPLSCILPSTSSRLRPPTLVSHRDTRSDSDQCIRNYPSHAIFNLARSRESSLS